MNFQTKEERIANLESSVLELIKLQMSITSTLQNHSRISLGLAELISKQRNDLLELLKLVVSTLIIDPAAKQLSMDQIARIESDQEKHEDLISKLKLSLDDQTVNLSNQNVAVPTKNPDVAPGQ